MPKINILDKKVAELIAAGEVVERPSSVIKELVENSIDSGATDITVEIKNGGTTFMRVTDNGCGIEKDDVKKAFLRNATSKVKTQDDLDMISTLGFRGEALASISAVSKVEMITRVKDSDLGIRYEVNGGDEIFFDDFGCGLGTTIIIRDIFYNTPARLKFLKKDVSEANSVSGILDRISLSHPEVSIKFIRDSKQTLNTPGDNNLDSCIYAVYGKDFLSSLMKIEYEFNGIKVSGFVSKPSSPRSSRSMQHFFINGRYVKVRTAMVALEEAFKGSIMVGKFPAGVIFIEMPLDFVDVNVHPAKIEVRFVNEKPIFDAVYYAVKTALRVGDAPPQMHISKPQEAITPNIKENLVFPKNNNVFTPQIIEKEKQIFSSPIKPLNIKKDNIQHIDCDKLDKAITNNISNKNTQIEEDPEIFIPKTIKYEKIEINPPEIIKQELFKKNTVEDTLKSNFMHKLFTGNNDSKNLKQESLYKDVEENIISQVKDENHLKIIGEAFNTYIIVQNQNNSLIFIDKHAAHERMIYEKLKNQRQNDYSQVLLVPKNITLDKSSYDAVISNLEIFSESGFEVEDFGPGIIIVRSTPVYMKESDIEDSIIEMSSYLVANKKDVSTAKIDWMYHNIACRAAVKAGSVMKDEEIIIPDEVLLDYMSDAELVAFNKLKSGIFLVTIYGEKPDCGQCSSCTCM